MKFGFGSGPKIADCGIRLNFIFLKVFVCFLYDNFLISTFFPSFSSFYIKGSVGRLEESKSKFTAC